MGISKDWLFGKTPKQIARKEKAYADLKDQLSEFKNQREANKAKKESEKIPHCSKCKSKNIQLLGQDKKGFSFGKATGGALLTGGVGLLAGFAGKNGKFQWVCMDCGNRFEMK
jgi:hypothetical protein